MANKYIQQYNTQADYEAATKELPNVSWILSTNEVKYKKGFFIGSVAGDVLMWDVANEKLVATVGGDWDATTYPIASYVPIAVNVISADETPDNRARWISLNTLGSFRWGVGSIGSGVEIGGISDENALSGRNYTDTVLNFSGYNATDYAAFNAVNTFVTSGTSAGDWFLPSLGELKFVHTHKDAINASLAAIHTASSSAASEIINGDYWSSSEYDKKYAISLIYDGINESHRYYYKDSTYFVRAFLML